MESNDCSREGHCELEDVDSWRKRVVAAIAEDTECLYSVMECKLTGVHGALGSADTS